jgi:hypothetical protein
MEKHVKDRLVRRFCEYIEEAYEEGRQSMWRELDALRSAMVKMEQEKLERNCKDYQDEAQARTTT